VRIPTFLMTVFAGVVYLLTALENSRGILGVCRIDGLRRGVMQTMSNNFSDPSYDST